MAMLAGLAEQVASVINVQIRVYGELNDFLPPVQRQVPFLRRIPHPTSVKDLLEGVGVPHPEIAAVLVDDASEDFGFLVERDCRVTAFPLFRQIVSDDLVPLRPARPDEPRFVIDVHLGRLARYLRLLGIDAHYDTVVGDDRIIGLAHEKRRILLTRDRELLMRKAVIWGYFVRKNDPREQFIEVVKRFDLSSVAKPYSRCMNCNGLLAPVNKADVEDRLEPNTRQHFERFWQCQTCGNVYWRGSHYERLERLVACAGTL
jgi:uncharacterized protein